MSKLNTVARNHLVPQDRATSKDSSSLQLNRVKASLKISLRNAANMKNLLNEKNKVMPIQELTSLLIRFCSKLLPLVSLK